MKNEVFKKAEEEYSSELLEKWQKLQNKIDEIQPKFETLLRKSISKSTDISKVNFKINRKTLDSTYEKFKRKKRDIGTFSDLLRAVIVISSKTNPKNIINGIKYYFNIVKIDEKTSSGETPYEGVIHIDVNVDGLICEIQIMSRHLHTYKQLADKIYKSDLPEEKKKKLQKKWFERAKLIENDARMAYFMCNSLYKKSLDLETLDHEDITSENLEDILNKIIDSVEDITKIEDETGLKISSLIETLKEIKHSDDDYHHGETIFEHTKEVLDDLENLSSNMNEETKKMLKLTAIFHDLGKAFTLEEKDGKMTFHGHAKVSADILEKLFKKYFDEKRELYENLLILVKGHDDILNLINNKKGSGYKYLKKFLESPLYQKNLLNIMHIFVQADSIRGKAFERTKDVIEQIVNEDIPGYFDELKKKEEEKERKKKLEKEKLISKKEDILSLLREKAPKYYDDIVSQDGDIRRNIQVSKIDKSIKTKLLSDIAKLLRE
jgi:putative nucleotidyltransferase with HDIG domain